MLTRGGRLWRWVTGFAISSIGLLLWAALGYLWVAGKLHIDPALAGLYPVSLLSESGSRLGFGPYPVWSGDYTELEFSFSVVLLLTLIFTVSAQLVLAESLACGRLGYAAALVLLQLSGSGSFLFKVTRRTLGFGDWSPLIDMAFWLVGVGFQCILLFFHFPLSRGQLASMGSRRPGAAAGQLLALVGSVVLVFFLSWQLSALVPGQVPLNEPPSRDERRLLSLAGQDVPLGPGLLVMPWVAYVASLFFANTAFFFLALALKHLWWLPVVITPLILSEASFFCSGHWSWVTLDHFGRLFSLVSTGGRNKFLFGVMVCLALVIGTTLRSALLTEGSEGTEERGMEQGRGAPSQAQRRWRRFFVTALLLGFLAVFGLLLVLVPGKRGVVVYPIDSREVAVVGLPQGTAQGLALRLGPDCRYCGWSWLPEGAASGRTDLRLRFLCGTELRELVWAKREGRWSLRAERARGIPLEGVGGCVTVSREVAHAWKGGLAEAWVEGGCNLRVDGGTAQDPNLKVPMRVMVGPRSDGLVAQFLAFCTCQLSLETVYLGLDGVVWSEPKLRQRHVLWVGGSRGALFWITVDRFAVPGEFPANRVAERSTQWRLWSSSERLMGADGVPLKGLQEVAAKLWVLPRVADVAGWGRLILLADRGGPYSQQHFFLVDSATGHVVSLPFRARDAFFMDASQAEAFRETIQRTLD